MSVRDDLVRIIDDVLGDDPRTALLAYHRLTAHELPWLEQRVVMHARANDWNWATIGRLLGRTRQSMRQRFDGATLALRPDPHLQKHRQESAYRRIAEDVRRSYDDDPIGW
ncbi:MAG: hypothetical protein JWL72_1031 [Ilumatobacteraceae bacterium]|nr:hypothetical protein [Ilumatobacteraceae bacterium]